ncbi:MAG: DNA-directed RNA polymerase subunit D [Thermoplasmatales archaeon]|jgi:DNA-directed RNA polymerase subunit D|nr:DNA-directed RNA polymerase subunit D [Thermoplasmatales archaeon]
MLIEILEMEETKAKFILRDTTPAKANALRRALLSDIPKMAIDKVEFHLGSIDVDGKDFESVTPLFDEIIAHRLGMVPVPTDLDLFNFQKDCVCGGEGCPNCTIMYSLNKNGPCTVYSGDLEPLGSPDFRVKDEHIPIVELSDGQSVLIYAHAVMGTAKEHVKWQVANGVGYKYMPAVTVKSSANAKEVAASCPRKVFDIDGKDLIAARPLDCILCNSCVEVDGGKSVSVQGDDKNFVFSFETDGSLTAEKALMKAADLLSEKTKAFAESISDITA